MAAELRIINPDPKYAKAKLVEPTPLGYVYIAATVQPGPIPLVLPSVKRARLLARIKDLAQRLELVDSVVNATVFRGIAIPPTARLNSYLRERAASIRVPRFDVLLLIETTSPDSAHEVKKSEQFAALVDALRAGARTVQVITARNSKRIGDVDKSRQGLFLFNHFIAENSEIGLELWEYLARWFAVETELDNSVLLVPQAGESSDYSFINFARWDLSLFSHLWHQISKKSFKKYVLANLEANRVGSMPVLCKLA